MLVEFMSEPHFKCWSVGFFGLELVSLAAHPNEEHKEKASQSKCGGSAVSFHKLKVLMVNDLKE